ncbi:unnamed protein product [Moneuplotes crassus]|uniref:Uncharacterized protein n=1 Tax=Euplotes crassus TaxID=5936 RepID=A0AAD1XQT9_EUPCR|nr:unnamed protein product [Moneuplotes crassus]
MVNQKTRACYSREYFKSMLKSQPLMLNSTIKKVLANPKVFAFLIVITLHCTLQSNIQKCLPGFYDKECLPCHSSCRTCNDSLSCETCEGFMYKDESTSLCAFCQNGSYFNDVVQQCESCQNSCHHQCMHRDECLQCSPGFLLDLDLLQCVSECDEGKIELNSPQISIGRSCRSNAIYVDPMSDKAVEFGTLEHPYRTMKAAASEILNHYSHSGLNITVYIKDCYLEIDTFYVMNMTSLNLINHPDYQIMNRRAKIIASNKYLEGISERSSIHLLSHSTITPSIVIGEGNYTESELAGFTSTNFCFLVSRTNFRMENIDIYGDNIDNCIVTSYLQSKILQLKNMVFAHTGNGVLMSDPLELHIENIQIDVSRVYVFLQSFSMQCNYPEAYTTNPIYLNNISQFASSTSFTGGRIFGSGLPGNHSISNVNCSLHYSENLHQLACCSYLIFQTCIPTDFLTKTLEYSNFTFDGAAAYSRGQYMMATYLQTDLVHSRSYRISYSNFSFKDHYQDWLWPSHIQIGLGSEVGWLSNFSFTNTSISQPLVIVTNFKEITVREFTADVNHQLYKGILSIDTLGNVTIQDINLSEYNDEGEGQLAVVDIIPGSNSNLAFSNFWLQNVQLLNAPLISIQSMPAMILVQNFSLTDVQFQTGGSLLNFQAASAFSLSNMTFERIKPSYQLDTDARAFTFQTLFIELMNVGEIKDITIVDSVFTLVEVVSILNFTNSHRMLFLSNISYTDSVIPTRRALLSTQNIDARTNLSVTFDQLNFINISFTQGGSLLDLHHQLPIKVVVSNSLFKDITSGSIIISGSGNSDTQPTKVLFDQCQFENITIHQESLLVALQSSFIEISQTSLTRITSIGSISRMFSIENKSKMLITNASFSYSASATAALFQILTESYLSCTNCTIFNNFGLQDGLFSIESFGVIEVSGSQIYNNYGVQILLGSIFLSVDPSVVRNTSIHQNILVKKTDIQREITDECVHLCFLSADMINYLQHYNLDSLTESEYLLEVVQGALEIIESSTIYDQSIILNSFLSRIAIADSNLTNMEFSISPLNILSSTLMITNCSIEDMNAITNNANFITENSGSISISASRYVNSNAEMLNIFGSEAFLEDLEFVNLTIPQSLMHLSYCTSFHLRRMILENLTVENKYILSIQNSQNGIVEDLQLDGLKKYFIQCRDTHFLRLTNLSISGSIQVFKFISSTVDLISDSEFSGNTESGSGGVISMSDSRANIFNTMFVNNSATSGGVIFFHCTSNLDCALHINSCSFRSNSASIKGGVIYYDYIKPNISGSNFSNNLAPYGPRFASYPTRIGKVGSKAGEDLALDDIGPGIPISSPLELALLDMDDQVMNLDNSNTVIILPINQSISSIKGTNVVLLQDGIVNFTSLAMHVDRKYKTATYSATSKVIDKSKIANVLSHSDGQSNLVANFRDCKPGEQILGDVCSVCPAGTYSLHWNSSECLQCDFNADCLGGNQVSLKPGHWRQFHNSTKIVECINAEACPGGFSRNTLVPTKCATGYTGNLCSQCVITDSSKYERINDFECRKCPNPVTNAIQVIGVIILVFGFFVLLVVINVKKTTESEISVLLRILTNYLQLVTVSISMSDEYPSLVISLFVPVKMFGGSADAFMSFDCFIKNSDITGPFGSNAIFKLFLLSFLPMILFLAISLIWLVLYFINKKWVKDLKRNLIISLVTIIFILHPKLAERSISIFRCVSIDEGVQVARIDTSIGCYSYTHIKWCVIIAVPIILIWVTACPLVALVLILKNKDKDENCRVRQYFLTIRQGLKPNCVYWEFVNTLRKIIILISLLMTKTVSIFISLSVLLITSRLQVSIRPYKNRHHSRVEYFAVIGGVFSITAALLYSQTDQIPWLNDCVLGIILVINSKFILEWVYLVLKLYQDKHYVIQTLFRIISKMVCKKDKAPKQEEKQPDKKEIQKEHQQNTPGRKKIRFVYKRRHKKLRSRAIFKKKRLNKPKKSANVMPRNIMSTDLVRTDNRMIPSKSSKNIDIGVHMIKF